MSGIIQVICDRCHFLQQLTEQTRRYCLSDGNELGLERRLARCHDCRGVVEADRLASLEEIDEAIQRTLDREPLLLEGLALISRTVDEELQELNLIRNWRLQRRSPPKCLECGSTAIDYFKELSDPVT